MTFLRIFAQLQIGGFLRIFYRKNLVFYRLLGFKNSLTSKKLNIGHYKTHAKFLNLK